jgi:hypothetical protein
MDSAGGAQISSALGTTPDGGGYFLQYGSAVLSNQQSLLSTNGIPGNVGAGDEGGSALFPSTVTASTTNIITAGAGTSPVIQASTTAITVSCWVKPNVCTTGSVKQVMACYGTDASSLAAFNLYHLGSTAINHTFAFSVNVAGTLRTATATLPVIVVGTVYNVVGVYDGVSVRIYVNGILQGTTAITGLISYASIGAFALAMGNDGSTSDANLQGSLDEVAIYNKALTAARITYQYRQGSTYLPFPWNH